MHPQGASSSTVYRSNGNSECFFIRRGGGKPENPVENTSGARTRINHKLRLVVRNISTLITALFPAPALRVLKPRAVIREAFMIFQSS